MEPLPADEAHLWLAVPEAIGDQRLLDAYRALLSEEEATAHRRFLLPERGHAYLVTRALVRTVLSRYVPVEPSAWVFARNAWGRPEVRDPALLPGLRFSLAHTRGCIACVVVRGAEVGLDVEDAETRPASLEIADHFFSPAETAALRALPAPLRPLRFLELWTLKEAYIKARGHGFAIALDAFSMSIAGDGAIDVSFDPSLGDDRRAWQFQLLRPTPRHLAALAIRGRVARVVSRETVPLRT